MKKTLLVIATLLMSATAFAGINANSSWNKILSSSRHHAEIPKIIFGGLTWVSATNVCHHDTDKGTMLVTKKKFEVCLENDSAGDRFDCTRSVRKHLVKPQNSVKRVCLEYGAGESGDCLKYGNKTVSQPLDIVVDVHHAYETGEEISIGSLAFKKTLTIGSCK